MKRGIGKKGSSIIVVIVAMAFLGLLGALVLNVVLTNVQLKSVEIMSKRNFYTEEIAVNEVTAALEELSAKALKSSYAYQIRNYADFGVNDEERKLEYRKQYMIALSHYLQKTDIDSNLAQTYSVEVLQNMIRSEGLNVEVSNKTKGNKENGVIFHPTKTDEAGIDQPTYEYMTLKDVRISYTDKQNYENIITTDINLGMPVSSGLDTTFARYALISDQLVKVSNNVTLNGGIYAGTLETTESKGGDNVNPNKGGIWVDSVAGKLTVDGEYNDIITRQGIIVSDKAQLKIEKANIWAKNIITIGDGDTHSKLPSINIDATTRVQDDLTLKAKCNYVVLKDKYFGFSNGEGGADNSSSIAVNGKNTTLDLTGLNQFVLCGRTFVTSKSIASGLSKDIMMGQSIAAKYDQDAYLIPATAPYLKPKMNPITFEKINDYYNTNVPGKSFNTLDYHHIIDTNNHEWKELYNTYLDKDNPIRMYCYQLASGVNAVDMVNYYFNFKDEKAANSFHKNYFEHHKSDVIDTFNEFYDPTNNVKLSLGSSMKRYQVGANVVYYNNAASDKYQLKPATTPLPENEAKDLSNRFKSMQLTLKEHGGDMSVDLDANDKKNHVVDSIIDLVEMKNQIPEDNPGGGSYDFSEGTVVVKLVTEPKYVIQSSMKGIIIATGDVEVQNVNFTGLIIADGKIELTGNATIHADEALVLKILDYCLHNGNDLTKYIKAYQGSNNINGDGSISFANAITFENWKKNS